MRGPLGTPVAVGGFSPRNALEKAMKEQNSSVTDLSVEEVSISEIEACEHQVEVDWFPGDWVICTTRPSQ